MVTIRAGNLKNLLPSQAGLLVMVQFCRRGVGEDRPGQEDDFKAGVTCHCRPCPSGMPFSPFLFEERVCVCVFKYVILINHLVFDLKDHFQINT